KSKDIVQAKKPSNSNKAMNKALQEYDVKTNYRKASAVSKLAKKRDPGKPPKDPEAFVEEGVKQKPKRKKEPSGPRIGKSKPTGKKMQAPRQKPKRSK
ncbi:hypothetical protein LJB91_03825, partial [Bacteroidales bacterium OttesenSCG-928-L03]|nr:hypothetical protein [Bacteroidales bacterium OttesenSCG-928-L03]